MHDIDLGYFFDITFSLLFDNILNPKILIFSAFSKVELINQINIS